MPPIKVILVEDNDKFAGIFSKSLSRTDGIFLSRRFSSAEAALEAGVGDTDVVILDIGLPGMSGIELIKHIRALPSPPEILMLTAFEDEERLFSAMREGASGYVVKNSTADEMTSAIKDISNGGTVISPKLAKRFFSYLSSNRSQGAPHNPWELTGDEIECLSIMAKGFTNAETGRVLGMERRTVRTLLGHIYGKMKTRSRVEAVTMALNAGLLNTEGAG